MLLRQHTQHRLGIPLLQQEGALDHITNPVKVPRRQLPAAFHLTRYVTVFEPLQIESLQLPALDVAFATEEIRRPGRDDNGFLLVRGTVHPVRLGRDQEAQNTRVAFRADHK